jgi:hypothetical protein
MAAEADSPWPERPLIIVFLLGVLFFGWLAWTVGTRGLSPPSRAAHDCRERYASAVTLRDTLRVDLTYPTEYAQEFDVQGKPLTCGELREGARLPL